MNRIPPFSDINIERTFPDGFLEALAGVIQNAPARARELCRRYSYTRHKQTEGVIRRQEVFEGTFHLTIDFGAVAHQFTYSKRTGFNFEAPDANGLLVEFPEAVLAITYSSSYRPIGRDALYQRAFDNSRQVQRLFPTDNAPDAAHWPSTLLLATYSINPILAKVDSLELVAPHANGSKSYTRIVDVLAQLDRHPDQGALIEQIKQPLVQVKASLHLDNETPGTVIQPKK